MKPFLTASWLDLLNVSYAVPPAVLLPYLPKGMELDLYEGKAYVSLVPFRFEDTRLFGLSVPFHRSFPELNLRFYVSNGQSSGVVFIREFVTKYGVAAIANRFYNEHYKRAQLSYTCVQTETERAVCYTLIQKGKTHSLEAKAFKTVYFPKPGSLEYFLEHREYGFSVDARGETTRFRVGHPDWELYSLYDFKIHLDFEQLFGASWSFLQQQDPASILFIKGSAIEMFPLERMASKVNAESNSIRLSASSQIALPNR
jgi:uncharacterized protein YqjF (DUF2071 family)